MEDVKKRTVLSPPVARIHSYTPPLPRASAPILAVGKKKETLLLPGSLHRASAAPMPTLTILLQSDIKS